MQVKLRQIVEYIVALVVLKYIIISLCMRKLCKRLCLRRYNNYSSPIKCSYVFHFWPIYSHQMIFKHACV